MGTKFFTTTDQVKLAYTDMGSGPPVILMAGYSAPAAAWYDQEKVLLRQGYRVIAFDRRSHGTSENPPFGQDMLTHGKDLAALISHLGLAQVCLIGQSQGASTMWAYVAQFGADNLAGLISVDQTPRMLNDEEWSYGMYGLTAATRPTFFDKPLPNPLKKRPDLRIVLMMFVRGWRLLKFDKENTKPLLLDHADSDWRDAIRQTAVPVLFVAGAESPFWPKEHAEASAALCPQGEFAVVAGSGHAVNWECPREFDELMLAFLARLFARG